MAFVVAGIRIAESLSATRSIDIDGTLQTEGQNTFRINRSRVAAGQKNTDDSGRCANAGANPSTSSPVGPRSYDSAHHCGGRNRTSITAHRCHRMAGNQFRLHRHLLTVCQRQFRQLQGEPRGALGAPGPFCFAHPAHDRLTSLRYHHAIHHQRRSQTCEKRIALLVSIRREPLVNSNGHVSALLNHDSGR